MRILGGNIDGPPTVAFIKFVAGISEPIYSVVVSSGAHFEQMPTDVPAVLFTGTGGSLKGFDNITFDDGNYFYQRIPVGVG